VGYDPVISFGEGGRRFPTSGMLVILIEALIDPVKSRKRGFLVDDLIWIVTDREPSFVHIGLRRPIVAHSENKHIEDIVLAVVAQVQI
jgi:hypothetical protein